MYVRTMHARFAILFLLILAACNKRREVAVATSDECTAAMDRVVKQALDARRERLEKVPSDKVPPPPEPARAIADRAARTKTALVARCVDDRWSAAVVRCFLTANAVVDCERGLGKHQLAGYRTASSEMPLETPAGSGSAAMQPAPPHAP